MECPKCQYVRKASDTAPDYECPKCGVIYAKFVPAVLEREAALRAKLAMRQAEKQPLPPVEAKEPQVIKEPPVKEPPLKKPPIEEPVRNVTNCPACGGLVAFGIKACPHCGKTKPAPEPKKPTSKVAWVLAGLVGLIMLSAIGSGGGGGGGTSNSSARDKFVNDPAMRSSAQTAIQLSGYRCESVTNMTTLLIGRGVKVVCDNYRDIYSVTDEGGRLIVRLE